MHTLIVLTPGFPKDEEDRSSLPSQQLLIKAFNQQFPHIRIIILSFQYPFSSTTYRWMNNDVIPFNGRNRGGLFRLYIWVSVWFKLLQLRKQYKEFGMLSFWFSECTFIGKKFASRYNLRHYTWICGQDARKENRYAKRMRVCEEELIAMSDFLVHEFYYNHHVMPAHMIPNAIDESLFPQMPSQRDIDVLGVGSLIPLKQFEIFIDVIDQLRIQLPNISAAICGDGPLMSQLQTKIEKLGLQRHIQLIGALSHDDTIAVMQRSKILLHPSSYEGMSTACLEALYAGANVISFVRSMSVGINKWTIVKSKKEMCEKALTILKDQNANFERVQTFTIQQTAKSIIDLYAVNS